MSDTKAIQKTAKQRVDGLMQALIQREQTFQTLLPEGMRVSWFLGEVRVALARAPGLAECENVSVVDALTTCAQLGLSPSGRLGSAYLIPYKTKCTLVIGYRGYVDLAYRSGDVQSFHAEVVHEKDTFVHEEGLTPVLRHIRSEDENPGPLRAVYAIARMKDGGVGHVVMYRREVLAIKARSKASGSGPWVTDEGEMWKKTALRRLIKLLPLSPTRAKGLFQAEAAEREQEEAMDADFSVVDGPPASASGVERAKAEARKALAPPKDTLEGHLSPEPSEEEKAAIRAAEMEPGSEG